MIVHNCENAVQATSREILMPAVVAAERYGYPVILKVYDEIVTEPKIGFGSQPEFEEIVLEAVRDPALPWCDWPISVDAWTGTRYKK